MIKMKATTKFKYGEKLGKDLRDKLKKYKHSYVTIGIHADAGQYPGNAEVVEVAFWNEFGTNKTPERSFFRSALNDNEAKINWLREQAIKGFLYEGWPIKQALDYMGENITILVQNKIKSNVPPPYGTGKGEASAEEIAQRQRYKAEHSTLGTFATLQDSGLMLRSVTWRSHVE